MTHRQFLAWRTWHEAEWGRPDRHDYYMMQVAQSVKRQWAKKPDAVKLEHQYLPQDKIPFGKKRRAESVVDLHGQTAVAQSKSLWVAAIGGKVREVPD